MYLVLVFVVAQKWVPPAALTAQRPHHAHQPASPLAQAACSVRGSQQASARGQCAAASQRPKHTARSQRPQDAACRHAAIPNGIRIGSSYKSCSPICNI